MADHMIFASIKRPRQIKIKALLRDQNNAIIITMTSLLADDHVIVVKRDESGRVNRFFVVKKGNQDL